MNHHLSNDQVVVMSKGQLSSSIIISISMRCWDYRSCKTSICHKEAKLRETQIVWSTSQYHSQVKGSYPNPICPNPTVCSKALPRCGCSYNMTWCFTTAFVIALNKCIPKKNNNMYFPPLITPALHDFSSGWSVWFCYFCPPIGLESDREQMYCSPMHRCLECSLSGAQMSSHDLNVVCIDQSGCPKWWNSTERVEHIHNLKSLCADARYIMTVHPQKKICPQVLAIQIVPFTQFLQQWAFMLIDSCHNRVK